MVKGNKSKSNIKNLKTVSINNLSHFYGKNENKKQVLNDVNLNIDKGLVLLKGPSGCGKTTLLTLIGALRTCQSGDLTVLNNQLNGASRKTRQILRKVLNDFSRSQSSEMFNSRTKCPNGRRFNKRFNIFAKT